MKMCFHELKFSSHKSESEQRLGMKIAMLVQPTTRKIGIKLLLSVANPSFKIFKKDLGFGSVPFMTKIFPYIIVHVLAPSLYKILIIQK